MDQEDAIMDLLQPYLDRVSVYGTGAEVGAVAFTTLVVLMSIRLVFKPLVRSIVYRTEAQWDQLLLDPLFSRTYLFVVIFAINLGWVWIDRSSLEPAQNHFLMLFVVIMTSILSVSIKHIFPRIMARFSSEKGVIIGGQYVLPTILVRFGLWMLGLNFGLGLIGVEMVGFFASLAVFSLVVAVAAQQTLGNILNSSMLALDQPFEVGDRIEVDGMTGTVVSFGTLSTKILTLTEHLVIIPNNTLVSSTIINHARGGGDGIARRLSLHIDYAVDYREKNAHVKDVITRTARRCPYVTGDPEPRSLLRSLNEYSKDFRLYAWIDDYNDEFLATDWLLREVDEAFEKEGISIPYPIAVELQDKPESFEGDENFQRRMKKKKTRQHIAEMKQKQDEMKFQEERDNAREEIEFLENLLESGTAKSSEREEIQADIDALKSMLARFTE
ncbi:MAG: hypothetical protein DWC07_01020 [Candidatus Poseidoniales archaeon]|nr:MAG: hypothetical protein DWC07_01020 [Candidatus Poseidoniales archaeon]